MKRKFSKILGVGLTVALITSLLLVAAPVSALTQPTVVPTSTTISATTTYSITFSPGKELGTAYTFQVQDKGGPAVGAATWALDAGEYAAHLSTGDPLTLMQVDFVSVVVPYNADLSTITELGYSYKIDDGRPANDSAPYLLLELDTTDNDTADTWVVHHMFVTAAADTWGTWLLSTDTLDPAWHAFPGDTDYTDWAAVVAAFGTDTVLNVKVAVGEWDSDHLESHYVDDIKINTTTYNLEPDTITITFPVGTVVPTATAIPGATLVASPGWISGVWSDATTTGVTFASDATKRTVTATLDPNTDEIGEGATVRIKVPGITNPSAVGSYTLTVKTSKETTAVESAPYSVKSPTILPLPGVVERYNSADVLMAQTNSISDAIALASKGDTIKVGAGTYDEDLIINKSITLIGDAATTIIKDTDKSSTGGMVTISFPKTSTAAGVVFDGFTVMGDLGGDPALSITGIGVTVQNCVFTKAGTATSAVAQTMVIVNPGADTTTYGNTITNSIFDTTLGATTDTAIDVQATKGENTTISGCTFSVDGSDTAIAIADGTAAKPVKVTDCTISGASGNGIVVTAGVTKVSDSTLSNLKRALSVTAGTVTLSGNTIDTCGLAKTTTVAAQAAIAVVSTAGLSITNTTISNCPNEIIQVTADSDKVNMMFNNLIDNALGVDNNDTVLHTLNATHNWWGAATGPATGMNVGTTTGKINATSYLGGEATGNFALASASLITKKTVGVDVTATPSDATKPAIIGVANYSANPQDATKYPALDGGFYDVYLADVAAGDTASVLIKFYNTNVTANTDIYVWGTLAGGWQAVTATAQGVNLYGGYAWVKVGTTTIPAITDLAGTPFALVESPVGALTTPDLTAPDTGAKDVSLTPTLAWDPVSETIGYDFELADNALFVVPLVKLDGDLGRLIVTFYQQVADLEYSTHYYWRVKAVSATATSAWSTGVFSTIAEPAAEPEPEARMWTCPQCGLTYSTRAKLEAHAGWAHVPEEPADIIIEPPDIEIIVPLPDVAAPITPAWIYIIIGVGAVLVISVVVLIVRTRRVA